MLDVADRYAEEKEGSIFTTERGCKVGSVLSTIGLVVVITLG